MGTSSRILWWRQRRPARVGLQVMADQNSTIQLRNPIQEGGSHADMIDVQNFLRFLQVLPFRNVDVMLEAKAKDLALLDLRSQLWARWQSLKGWNVT